MKSKRNKLMFKMYQRGFTIIKVAEKFGITKQSVFSAFQRMGFVTRKKRPRNYIIVDCIKFSLRNSGYYAKTGGDRESIHRYLYKKHYGPIPKDKIVHHIDMDKENNNPGNFGLTTRGDHNKLHHTKKRILEFFNNILIEFDLPENGMLTY